jgi:HK97 family phage prohead protease
MYEDSHGLFVRGELFIRDMARAQEAYKLLQEHAVTGLSIGYRTKESHRDAQSGVRVLFPSATARKSLTATPKAACGC